MTTERPGGVELRWTGLSADPLPVEEVSSWLTCDDTGANVVFTGTTRDHSQGRSQVTLLSYEAWDAEADRRIALVEAELRTRWPEVRKVAILHRVGDVALGEAAVVVGVSSPHRDAAFEAARFAIDAVKSSVPIWKREHHGGGIEWGTDGTDLVDPSELAQAWARVDHDRGSRAEAAS